MAIHTHSARIMKKHASGLYGETGGGGGAEAAAKGDAVGSVTLTIHSGLGVGRFHG